MTVPARIVTPFLGALVLAAVPAGAAASASAGAETLGDRVFPHIGNGGYDVEHYDLALAYAPARRRLSGTATVHARATQGLSRLSLDYSGPPVSSVTVDGRPAVVRRLRRTRKLRITPATPIASGGRFAVAVAYAGRARPEETDDDVQGFIPNPTGAAVATQPVGSRSWFPNNDVPGDRATLSLRMTVPDGYEVSGNGTLRSRTTGPAGTTFLWSSDEPLSTYLMTANVGRFRVRTSTGPGGLPIHDAVARSLDRAVRRDDTITKLPRMIALYAARFGPYPFSSAGSTIVDDRANAGLALETQTRPTYTSRPDEATVAHETAHQWFGDAVGVRRWSDIWLNEGFATWAEWYYGAKEQGHPLRARLRDTLRSGRSLWRVAPGAPRSEAELFSDAVYFRGAATLEALRGRIGEPRFRLLLRRWYAEHRSAPATTRQFIALAEEVADRDLTPFFRAWLYAHRKPAKRFR